MPHAPGLIVIWSGAILDIPPGWTLCDGTLGTPDLRDRFILGAGDSFNPGDTGGSLAHTHTFTGDGHTHDMIAGDPVQTGSGRDDTSIASPTTGTTDPGIHTPPYFALAFIMRI